MQAFGQGEPFLNQTGALLLGGELQRGVELVGEQELHVVQDAGQGAFGFGLGDFHGDGAGLESEAEGVALGQAFIGAKGQRADVDAFGLNHCAEAPGVAGAADFGCAGGGEVRDVEAGGGGGVHPLVAAPETVQGQGAGKRDFAGEVGNILMFGEHGGAGGFDALAEACQTGQRFGCGTVGEQYHFVAGLGDGQAPEQRAGEAEADVLGLGGGAHHLAVDAREQCAGGDDRQALAQCGHGAIERRGHAAGGFDDAEETGKRAAEVLGHGHADAEGAEFAGHGERQRTATHDCNFIVIDPSDVHAVLLCCAQQSPTRRRTPCPTP